MAYASENTRAFDGASVRQRLDTLRGGLAERMVQYRVYRTTMRELGSLTDRELGDIGLHRSMIRDIARDAASRA